MNVLDPDEFSFDSIEWDDQIGSWYTDDYQNPDIKEDRLISVWTNDNRSYFGAIRDGIMFVSSVRWICTQEIEYKIYKLREAGVSPYDILVFMEL